MTAIVLDACVLIPAVLREVVLGYARAGGFRPLWSSRIFGEWIRVAARRGPDAEAAVQAHMALADGEWPDARLTGWEDMERQILLPDPADAHVLAAAIVGEADLLMTSNTRDFPPRVLARFGVTLVTPDGFLRGEWAPGAVLDEMLDRVRADVAPGEDPIAFRRILKRTGLPRLGKAWALKAR